MNYVSAGCVNKKLGNKVNLKCDNMSSMLVLADIKNMSMKNIYFVKRCWHRFIVERKNVNSQK